MLEILSEQKDNVVVAQYRRRRKGTGGALRSGAWVGPF